MLGEQPSATKGAAPDLHQIGPVLLLLAYSLLLWHSKSARGTTFEPVQLLLAYLLSLWHSKSARGTTFGQRSLGLVFLV